MAVQVKRLSGDDWQDWANQILSRHYGPTEYVRIADNQKGDAGIEGYSRCGHAYQCYGCEEPISTEKRYEKQRDKLTIDIGKFIANRIKLVPLFGTVSITRWILFVPYFDSKDIISHANRKRDDVVLATLPYVAQDFQIHVCDEAHFGAERDFLLGMRCDALALSSTPATPNQIADWSGSETNYHLVQKLDEKLGRLNTLRTDEDRERFRDTVLRWYLEGQELLSTLRNYPEVFEKVLMAKNHRENSLAMSCLTHEGTGAALLKETLGALVEDYRSEVKVLAKPLAESLAWEAVSDWLLRCPLDFPREIPCQIR